MSRSVKALDYVKYWAFNRIPPRPRQLRIEITNHCNLECTICDRGAMSRDKRQMAWPLFQKICKDAIDFGIPNIGLNRFGEPMLHPKLSEMIRFAKNSGAKHVDFTTNGTLLTKDQIHGVLEAGVDMIAVSIDGFKRETYEGIRIGAKYDDVAANVRKLVNIRDRLKARTQVQLNFVCTKDTVGEARAFYRHWRKIVDSFFFIPFMGYAGTGDMSPMGVRGKRTKCYMLWYMITSSVEGHGGVCCQGDPDHVLDIGDLGERSFKDIWNGPEIKRIRDVHFRRAWGELPICAACDMTCPHRRWIRHSIATYFRVHSWGAD